MSERLPQLDRPDFRRVRALSDELSHRSSTNHSVNPRLRETLALMADELVDRRFDLMMVSPALEKRSLAVHIANISRDPLSLPLNSLIDQTRIVQEFKFISLDIEKLKYLVIKDESLGLPGLDLPDRQELATSAWKVVQMLTGRPLGDCDYELYQDQRRELLELCLPSRFLTAAIWEEIKIEQFKWWVVRRFVGRGWRPKIMRTLEDFHLGTTADFLTHKDENAKLTQLLKSKWQTWRNNDWLKNVVFIKIPSTRSSPCPQHLFIVGPRIEPGTDQYVGDQLGVAVAGLSLAHLRASI